MRYLFTEEQGGKIVESDTMTLLRGLGTVVSAAAGAADYAGSEMYRYATSQEAGEGNVTASAERAIRLGEGFMDVFGRWGNAAGKAMDEAVGPNPWTNFEEQGQILGGLAGFVVDIALPMDMFIGKSLESITDPVRKAAIASSVDAMMNAPDLQRAARDAAGVAYDYANVEEFAPTIRPVEGVSPVVQAQEKFVASALADGDAEAFVDAAMLHTSHRLRGNTLADDLALTIEASDAELEQMLPITQYAEWSNQNPWYVYDSLAERGWFNNITRADRDTLARQAFGSDFDALDPIPQRYVTETLAFDLFARGGDEVIQNAIIRQDGPARTGLTDLLNTAFPTPLRRRGLTEDAGNVPRDTGTQVAYTWNAMRTGDDAAAQALYTAVAEDVARRNFTNALKESKTAMVHARGGGTADVWRDRALFVTHKTLADLSVRVPDTDVRVPRPLAPAVAQRISQSPVAALQRGITDGTATYQDAGRARGYLDPVLRRTSHETLDAIDTAIARAQAAHPEDWRTRTLDPLDISPDIMHDMYAAAANMEARRTPGWTSLAAEGAAISDLRAPSRPTPRGGMFAKMREVRDAFATRTRAAMLENVIFQSSDMRRTRLGDAVRATMDNNRAFKSVDYAADPVWGELTTDVRNRMATIGESFDTKLEVNRAENPDLTAPQVWFKTVVDDFRDPADFLDSYVQALFGGLERVSKVVEGAGTMAGARKTAPMINKFLRNHVFRHSEFYGIAQDSFAAAVEVGNYEGAIRTLTGLHAGLIGRTAEELVDDVAAARAAIEADADLSLSLLGMTPLFPVRQGLSKSTQIDGFEVPTTRLITGVYAQRYYANQVLEATDRHMQVYAQRYFEAGLPDIVLDLGESVRRSQEMLQGAGLGDVMPEVNAVLTDADVNSLAKTIERMVGSFLLDGQGTVWSELLEETWTNVMADKTLAAVQEGLDDAEAVAARMDIAEAIWMDRMERLALDAARQADRVMFGSSSALTEGVRMNRARRWQRQTNRVPLGGPVDEIRYMPTIQFDGDLRKALSESLALEDATDDIDKLKVLDMEPGNAEALDAAFAMNLNTAAQNLVDQVDHYGTSAAGMHALEFVNGAKSLARGGALGGAFLPHPAFLMMNLASAPFIMGQQFGFDRTARILKKGVLGSVPAGQFHLFAMGKGSARAEDVLLTTPTGKAYTYGQVRDIVNRASLSKSQAKAESVGSLAQEMRRSQRGWAGRNLDPAGFNIWNGIANEADNGFRIRTLLDALEEGEPIEQATTLAREAALDYGKLPEWERRFINPYFWFWTFQSRFAASTISAAINNPQRLYVASRFSTKDLSGILGEMGYEDAKYENDQFSRDYLDGRAYRVLLENSGERYAIYGPDLPLSSSLSMILDTMAGAKLFMELATPPATKTRGDVVTDIEEMGPRVVMERATPGIKVTGTLLGYDPGTFDYDLPGYMDPRLVATLQAAGQWELFTSIVEVEPATDRPYGQTTFEGQVWQVKESSKMNWALMNHAMLTTGLQRTIRTYGPMFDALLVERERRAPNMRLGLAWLNFLGLGTPVVEMSREDAAIMAEKRRLWDARDRVAD